MLPPKGGGAASRGEDGPSGQRTPNSHNVDFHSIIICHATPVLVFTRKGPAGVSQVLDYLQTRTMPPPDSELFRWFTDEVQPHEMALRGWLGRRFPDLHDLDDIVQESFARLLEAKRRGGIASPRGFLFVTARNLALNELRHSRHELKCDGVTIDMLLDDAPTTFENVATAEEIQILVRAIQSLPVRCRQIVTLRKIYGLSQKEVALQLGYADVVLRRLCRDHGNEGMLALLRHDEAVFQ